MADVGLIRKLGWIFKHRAQVFRYFRTLAKQSKLMGGSVSEKEIPLLAELVQLAETIPGPIVEIGTLFGFSTQAIAIAKSPEKPLITVDNYGWNPIGLSYAHHRELTNGNLRYLIKRCNTSLFEGTSTAFYGSYSMERPAMVFIDADHEYEGVRVDLQWARDMKIPIVSGHDYSDSWPGVKRAVDEVFGAPTRQLGTLWAWIDPAWNPALNGVGAGAIGDTAAGIRR
jgi:hypothetical protein